MYLSEYVDFSNVALHSTPACWQELDVATTAVNVLGVLHAELHIAKERIMRDTENH